MYSIYLVQVVRISLFDFENENEISHVVVGAGIGFRPLN